MNSGAHDLHRPLDEESIVAGCEVLSSSEAMFATLYERNGPPPVWRREPGFATLVRLILEQQVSLASGAAAFHRLAARLGDVSPVALLTLDDTELRAVGFSRQKTRYVRLLAERLDAGTFSLDVVDRLDDEAAVAHLVELTGVGPWTATNYLLFAGGRPDLWPRGDRALVVSLGRCRGSDDVPSYDEADELSLAWRPWRSVAARLLWHDYLGGRAYDPSGF